MEVAQMPTETKLTWFQAHKHDEEYRAKHKYNSRRSYYVKLYKKQPELYAKSIKRLAIEDEQFAEEVKEFIAENYGGEH